MITTNIQKILVYYDFTDISKKSLLWAAFFAKRFKKELYLIHVIDQNTYNYFSKINTVNEILAEFQKICSKVYEEFKVISDFSVQEGCTCTVINSTAEKLDAFMVVLGTHGKNDPQYISGEAVVKIIRKSRFPYFVIQKNSALPDENKNIVLPLDTKKETKEKTGWVSFFGKNTPSKINMIYEDIEDDRLKNNIIFCSKFLNELKITYTKETLNKSWRGINSRAIKYANKNNGLMIIITTTKETNIFHKIFGFPETGIISNSSGIPVLCINPKKDLYIPCI